jgi:hypothetical protein
MASTSTLRIWWNAYGGYINPSGNAVHTHPELFMRIKGMTKSYEIAAVALPAYTALFNVLLSHGYQPQSDWAYNYRNIKGTSSLSLHSYGIAVDVDPFSLGNPVEYGAFAWSHTRFTKEQMAAVYRIRNTKGQRVWTWGGYWASKKDYMHFQLDVKPSALDIDWATVEEGSTVNVLKKDDTGNGVAKAQKALNAWAAYWEKTDWEVLVTDGKFGNKTEAAVKIYQGAAGLTQSGVIDGLTLAFLMEYIADYVSTVVAQGPAGPEGPRGPIGPAGPRGLPGADGRTPTRLTATEWST